MYGIHLYVGCLEREVITQHDFAWLWLAFSQFLSSMRSVKSSRLIISILLVIQIICYSASDYTNIYLCCNHLTDKFYIINKRFWTITENGGKLIEWRLLSIK